MGIYFSEGMTYEEPIAEFSNCTIEQNSAKIYGGGVRIVTAKSSKSVTQQLLLSTCTLSNNKLESIIVFTKCVWAKKQCLVWLSC